MTLNEFCEYISDSLAETKARIVIVPPGESWAALRLFYRKRGCIEVRLSDLVSESAWLPMPDEVFGRVHDKMTARETSNTAVVLLGMPGYLALLTEEKRWASISALREWVDNMSGREAVCFLRSDDTTDSLLKDVFANPRYRQGKQLIEIDVEQVAPQFEVGHTEVMLVGDDLAPFIPEACDTFQKYLSHTEEYPNDSSDRRIVIASKGRELAGLNAEVRQVLSLNDCARVFYGVVDAGLSEDALRWICERGKEGAGKKLPEILKTLFFPEGEIEKRALRVFDGRKGVEREALLWLFKHAASKGSYIDRVAKQGGVLVGNFRSVYVTGAADFLGKSEMYAGERRDAIREADVIMSDADIRQFIARCAGESTSQVAPWFNCGTEAERAELLRRCAVEGIASNALKVVYPEVAKYLNTDPVFDDGELEEYFRVYRELKMVGRVTPEFCERAQSAVLPSSVQARDAMVQRYASENGGALLVVDAMGADWLPMLVAMARERNIGVDSIAVGETHLPTSTEFNNINWPDAARRLPGIRRFDNIAHKGVEAHEARSAQENLAAVLSVIGGEVLPRVVAGLAEFERVLVTADHGTSRLAVLAWQSEPRLAQTLVCEADAEVSDWRYREAAALGGCPPELEETLDGEHWVVRGYNRLPKKGGGQGFELHGGATLEERLVPVVIFSRTGQFVPKAKTDGKRKQIVEKDDFDLG